MDKVCDQPVRAVANGERPSCVRRAPLIRVQVATVVKEGSSPLAWRPLRGAADVFAAFASFGALADRESFFAILLNVKHRVLAVEEVARGSLSATIVCPREVFKAATICNAAAIGFLHNHPSGDPTPSAEDIEITRRLHEAGGLLGIRLLDHLIVGRGRYISFVDDGLL